MNQQITHGARVAFDHPTDPRDGQTADVTNILCGTDGPRAYWLRFDDGSKFKANLAHITAPDTHIDAESGQRRYTGCPDCGSFLYGGHCHWCAARTPDPLADLEFAPVTVTEAQAAALAPEPLPGALAHDEFDPADLEPTDEDLAACLTITRASLEAQYREFGFIENGERVFPAPDDDPLPGALAHDELDPADLSTETDGGWIIPDDWTADDEGGYRPARSKAARDIARNA